MPKRDVSRLVDGFCRYMFESYASIRHNVCQSLLAVGSRPTELVDHETQMFQQCVDVALCNAARGAQEVCFGALKVVGRSPDLVVGHAWHDESAKAVSSNTHSANFVSWRSQTRAISRAGVYFRALHLAVLRLPRLM